VNNYVVLPSETITLNASVGSDSDCYYYTSGDGCFTCSSSQDDTVTVSWSAVWQGSGNPAGTFPGGSTGSSVQWQAPTVCSDANVVITATADDTGTTKYNDASVSDNTTVTVIPETTGYWEDLDPGFGCPAWYDLLCLADHEKVKSDGCGNAIRITCNSEDCAYKYWYNSTLVGKCVWKGAQNIFRYKMSLDDQRFLETAHATCNLDKGVDSMGEGCEGYYCMRKTEYNCVEAVPPIIMWIRDDGSTCPCLNGYPGGSFESCPGEDGIHPGYPN